MWEGGRKGGGGEGGREEGGRGGGGREHNIHVRTFTWLKDLPDISPSLPLAVYSAVKIWARVLHHHHWSYTGGSTNDSRW